MQLSNLEDERINFLLQRDELEATREWAEKTLNIYRVAISSPASHASQREYKPLFERSIKEFEEWLSVHSEANPRNAEI